MSDERKPQTDDKYIVRFPEGMRDRLKEEAKINNRTLNAELVARLEESFTPRVSAGDLQLAIDTYLATLENQAAMTEMRIQMARMQLANLHTRTHQLVRESQKDVTKMSAKELEDAEGVVDELKQVEREISQLRHELEELQKSRKTTLESIEEVRAAIKPKIKALKEVLTTRPLKG